MELGRWIDHPDLFLLASGLLLAVLGQHRAGRLALHPLALLSTWVHELSHGLAAMLVGGRLDRLHVYWDTSGLAEVRYPDRPLRAGLVFSAGYLGTAVVGAGLLYARDTAGGQGLLVLAAIMALSVLLWVRNLAGILLTSLVAAGLAAGGLYLRPPWDHLVFTLVALAVAMNATFGLRSLFGVQVVEVGGQPRYTDAAMVARLWGGPHWLWAGLWGIATVLLVGAGIRWG